MLLDVLRHTGRSPQQRTVWLQKAAVPSRESLPPLSTRQGFPGLCLPLSLQHQSSESLHFLNTAETRGCKGSGRLPLAPRPLSQMAEGSAATKHLMTCDKCGQTAGPGWASSKPLIGQGGLINNSAVTAGVLLSGRDGAPAASRPLGQALYGMGSSRTASDPCMVKCC